MAKRGLIRVPYYPQFNCLNRLDPCAPLVVSVITFWLTRSGDEQQYLFCPRRHNHQVALHLGIAFEDMERCIKILINEGLLPGQDFMVEPKEKTENSKTIVERRHALNLNRLSELLAKCSQGQIQLNCKLLQHAADDSFDFYDTIDEKFLPTTQRLKGFISATRYEQAAQLISEICVYVNEYHEEFALRAIAPGWKLLLAVPMNQSWQDYARELTVRFLRAGERAIDFSFTDGNFFLPDHAEIKATEHIVQHFNHSGKYREAKILASALMIALDSAFSELIFVSELDMDNLEPALTLLNEVRPDLVTTWQPDPEYYRQRRLTPEQTQKEQARFQAIRTRLNLPQPLQQPPLQ